MDPPVALALSCLRNGHKRPVFDNLWKIPQMKVLKQDAKRGIFYYLSGLTLLPSHRARDPHSTGRIPRLAVAVRATVTRSMVASDWSLWGFS